MQATTLHTVAFYLSKCDLRHSTLAVEDKRLADTTENIGTTQTLLAGQCLFTVDSEDIMPLRKAIT